MLKSVLIIDDDARVASAVARLFPGETRVDIVARPREALVRVLSGEVPDLILCDVEMPDMTGPELLERLPPEAAARTILMTGGASGRSTRRFLAEYRGPLLEKPFDLRDLEAAIARLGVGYDPTSRSGDP